MIACEDELARGNIENMLAIQLHCAVGNFQIFLQFNTRHEIAFNSPNTIFEKTTMKSFSEEDLKIYLLKIEDEALFSYNVYQIEGEGRNLFSSINGDENTIMGLPVEKIKEYLC